MHPLPLLRGYPTAVVRLAGDLAPELFPNESKATCTTCPLNPPPGDDPAGLRTFVRARCCTYQPDLPNFLAGQALASGGIAAERVRARLNDTGAVYDVAVISPWMARVRYEAEGEARFGVDESLRCPYWVDGPLNCGLHESRTAACRTWYCRHDLGVRGLYVYNALRRLLAEIETELAGWCARQHKAPWPWASTEAWERYYLTCFEAVSAIGDDELAALRRGLVGHRITLHSAIAIRDAAMPDVLRTAPHRVEPVATGTWRVTCYSPWDPIEAPAEVGVLFAELAEGRDWRQALDAVEARTGVRIDEHVVRGLWYAGALAG